MKFLRTCAVLAFAVLLATRTGHAAPETVTFKSGDQTVKALLYLPAGAGPHPAIVLVHEWWGVTDWVKAQAQDFADHGYVALVPDLYRGQSTSDPQVAHELMRGLPEIVRCVTWWQRLAISPLGTTFAMTASAR